MTTRYYLKLRNNILLESDLQLAERELNNLFSSCSAVYHNTADSVDFIPKEQVLSNTRSEGAIGYIATEPKVSVDKLMVLLSFIQEVWYRGTAPKKTRAFYSMRSTICAVPLMAMSEFLFFAKKQDSETATNIVTSLAVGSAQSRDIEASINRAKTSAPHIHAFHTYKAKFFPRFVHSLIVANYDVQKEHINVCDCFVGSGTTLVESSLMGHDSVGIDIDALSCFISEVKAAALNMTDSSLVNEVSGFGLFEPQGDNHYTFPAEIVRKFERWGSLDEMERYQNEISSILNQIDNEQSPYKELHKIALSDALTRKFNIRMMGTGSGRFALEIAKTELGSIIKSDIANEIKGVQTINTIKSFYGITTTPPSVIHGSATHRSIPDKSQDIIITSPPYIPASSGREDYLVGKLISLKAMGLYSEDNVAFTKSNSVGSMAIESDDLSGLPSAVSDLYHWLLNDELRCVKAKPIIAYYKSLKDALLEDIRTLKDNGRIIYIIGKETVFYNSSTKAILYKVDCDKIFVELAESLGLKVRETINIELDKKDNIARPRGSDKYYECAVIMEKGDSLKG